MNRLQTVIAEIEAARDAQEVEQLATYVGNVTADALTTEERKEFQLDTDNQCLGYELASTLPVERLRELFEEDSYGPAWEVFNSEQTEYYEQDEGRIEAYNAVLALLRGDPPIQDSVCTCGHWYEEHNGVSGCEAPDCTCRGFVQDLEASTPEAIADRGGDPEKWPEHVKRYFAEREESYRWTGWYDGAGDCEPPEPGKTWLTIEYPDGEEMATILHRTDTSLAPEVHNELRQQKEAAAGMIVEALNEHARDSAALDELNLLLSSEEWPGASGMEDVLDIVRRTGRVEIPNAPSWERH